MALREVGWLIDKFLTCSVRDCGVTWAGVEGYPLGADLIDRVSRLSVDLGNFPAVVLGASRVGCIGELGVFFVWSKEGIMT